MSLLKNKKKLVLIILALLLVVTGVVVFLSTKKPAETKQTEAVEEEVQGLVDADPSIKVNITESKAKANAIVITAIGLEGKAKTLEYEITYDSEGQIKGATTEKPIDVTGDKFEREIYLGTCSKNVCTADKGVSEVSITMKFTDENGIRSKYIGKFTI